MPLLAHRLVGTGEECDSAPASVPWMRQLADAAPAFLDPFMEGRTLLLTRGDVQRAIGKFHQTLQVAAGLSRNDWTAYSMSQLVHCHERCGNPPAAMQCVQQALNLARQGDNKELAHRVLSDKIRISRAMGLADDEMEALEQQAALGRGGTGSRDLHHACLGHLSERLLQLGEPVRALRAATEMKEAGVADRSAMTVESALDLMGASLLALGMLDKAAGAYTEGARLAASRRDAWRECTFCIGLLDVHLQHPTSPVQSYRGTRLRIDKLPPAVSASFRPAVQERDELMKKKEVAAVAALLVSLAA